jgi:hypothetical protein
MRIYVPKTDEEKAVFQEMQIFMDVVMEEHLKTDKGKSLVSKYEVDNNAQSIYHELKKHGTLSTAAWLAGDTLTKYIINAKDPDEKERHLFWICLTLARTAGKIRGA